MSFIVNQKAKLKDLDLPYSYTERVLEFFSLGGILSIWGYLINLYSEIPEIIPRHFSLSGEPDAFGDKSLLWLLPIIATIIYAAMTYVAKIPHLYNYPVKITAENAAEKFLIARKMVNFIKFIIVAFFVYMSFNMVYTGMGNQSLINIWFLAAFLAGLLAPVVYYFIKIRK